MTTGIGTGGNDQVHGVAIDSSGNIVAAGFSYDSSNNCFFAVARYTASGVNASTSILLLIRVGHNLVQ